jgi:hypothetical protein
MLTRLIRSSDYDSSLITTRCSPHRNADLVLSVRVHLVCRNPTGQSGTTPDSDGTPVPITQWPQGKWDKFKNDFTQAVQRTFENKLWLVPTGPWGCDVPTGPNPTHRPNVKCGLSIQLVNASKEPHLTLQIFHTNLPQGQIFRSYMNRSRGRGELAHTDVTSELTHSQEGHTQIVAAHELAHFLGLSHPHCRDNDLICYGSTAHQRGDLLGYGHRVEAWHARPWMLRIRRHLGGFGRGNWCRWSVVTRRPLPQRIPPNYAPTTSHFAPGGMPSSGRDGGV